MQLIDAFLNPLLGGTLIGVAVTVMLLFNGRVTGISGIINGALIYKKGDWDWRLMFLVGMITGGVILLSLAPQSLANTTDRSLLTLSIAGFLVGFGTIMGSGCTSGHGVCGLSRLSLRSIAATLTFMLMGFLTVMVWRWVNGGGL